VSDPTIRPSGFDLAHSYDTWWTDSSLDNVTCC